MWHRLHYLNKCLRTTNTPGGSEHTDLRRLSDDLLMSCSLSRSVSYTVSCIVSHIVLPWTCGPVLCPLIQCVLCPTNCVLYSKLCPSVVTGCTDLVGDHTLRKKKYCEATLLVLQLVTNRGLQSVPGRTLHDRNVFILLDPNIHTSGPS